MYGELLAEGRSGLGQDSKRADNERPDVVVGSTGRGVDAEGSGSMLATLFPSYPPAPCWGDLAAWEV